MSITTQAALLGLILCLGLICLVLRFAPARASLKEAMTHLTGEGAHLQNNTPTTDYSDFRSRVGTRLYPHTIDIDWIRIPTTDLAVLRMSVPRFLGEKALTALIGLALPPIAHTLLITAGINIPWSLPVIGSLALAAALFFAPDLEIKNKANAAREEFARSLGAYIEFVVLNRTGGVGAVQSLERAAAVGDSWVFRRIDEELQKAQRIGRAPWGQLERLATDLDLPDLADLVDIMTLTGEHGASVSDTLSANASSLRNAILSKELGRAGSATEKLHAPLATLGIIFMALLTVAAIGNIFLAGGV